MLQAPERRDITSKQISRRQPMLLNQFIMHAVHDVICEITQLNAVITD